MFAAQHLELEEDNLFQVGRKRREAQALGRRGWDSLSWTWGELESIFVLQKYWGYCGLADRAGSISSSVCLPWTFYEILKKEERTWIEKG